MSDASVLGSRTYPRNQALHIPMRDGVLIALDLWLPEDLSPDRRIGTVLRATRYWRACGYTDRALERDSNFALAEVYNGAGFAYVIVDARGTGASFGTSARPWSEDEIADYGEVVEWVTRQAWSNGKVATIGISYDANTAEASAIPNPPGLTAVVPRFSDFDFFTQVACPGGVLHNWLLQTWSDYVHHLDENDVCAAAGLTGEACAELLTRETGVKPVDGDGDGRLLAQAVDQHAANPLVFDAMSRITYKDDRYNGGATMAEIAMPSAKEAIERSGVRYQAWASWLDAGTQLGVLSRFNTFNNPQQVIIGAWNHGARTDADPFRYRSEAPAADSAAQLEVILEFLRDHLTDDGAPLTGREIRYYTLGAGTWRTTPVWPPLGSRLERWYFAAGGLLTPDGPGAGSDTYTVDFSATTGVTNRWHTQLGGSPVLYPNRTEQAQKLLVYRSAPLDVDLDITGHPVVHLSVASTQSDGAFHVYLEAVDPAGAVTYLTEGILRGLHRAVRPAGESPAAVYGPFHSYLRADAAPLVPGQQTVLHFDLFPTSALVPRGWRLQVGIAGADAESFERIPDDGIPELTLDRAGSWIDLPVMRE